MPGGARRRAAHGALAGTGATVTFEAVASDEVRPVPADAADPIQRRGNGTFTPAGAAAAARRRADLERMPDFAEQELEFIPAEDFAPFDRARRELTRATGSFLATASGGLSCNVWPTVRGACWLTAFAEYFAADAAKTGNPKSAEKAARFFAMASIERAKADDAAAREAAARPKNALLELDKRLGLLPLSTTTGAAKAPEYDEEAPQENATTTASESEEQP